MKRVLRNMIQRNLTLADPHIITPKITTNHDFGLETLKD